MEFDELVYLEISGEHFAGLDILVKDPVPGGFCAPTSIEDILGIKADQMSRIVDSVLIGHKGLNSLGVSACTPEKPGKIFRADIIGRNIGRGG